MKITVLTENSAGGKFLAEHGLSYLIEMNKQKVLFDTGHSDVFLKNAEKMGINPDDVEIVVLSHGHWDHGDGLRFLENKTLLAHPSAFIRRFRKHDLSPVGLTMSRTEIEKKFNLIESTAPLEIIKNLFFLGEIPRTTPFEAQTTTFTDDFRNEDFIIDDSALAAIENNELVVITGCSHSGICNIVEQAKKVSGISRVKAVIGGFHLKYQDKQTRQTIDWLKSNKITNVFPAHCTELPALAAFYEAFKFPQLKTGMVLDF